MLKKKFMKKFDKKPDRGPTRGVRVKKKCGFCKDAPLIDYKNLEVLSRFLNVKGRITSRRVNGNCAKHQRKMSKQVKRARFLALLPYVAR